MKKARLAATAFALCIFAGISAQSQLKVLNVTDITPELSVYPCGDRQEAQVILRCQEAFDLVLSSNYDADLNLTITTEGPEKVYAIVFKTKEEGTSFKGRQLTIAANGFQKYYIPLNLNAKEKLEFLVSDPYSKLRSLFYTATEEGIRLFSAGMYDAAIDQFRIAKQCPEFDETDNHIDSYISRCDTLKAWTEQAEEYTKEEKYFEARSLYLKMMSANPECSVIEELYKVANEDFNRVSRHDMEVGQAYYDKKRYEEARKLYEHAISHSNPQSAQAGVNLASINMIRYKSDNHTRSLSYIYEPDYQVGLMTAGLKPDKSGGYFSFGFDKGTIDLASQALEPITDGSTPNALMYKCMVSAGWTLRIYARSQKQYIPKVWALFTPFSYAGGGYYTKTLIPDSSTAKPEYETSYHWMNAVAPEAGIAVRLWRVIFSYRYQYRYPLNVEKSLSDDFCKSRNLIGLGFCW